MFEELADGVFRRRYESLDLNVGVVLGEQGLLVIDTRASHVEADELRQELRTLTTLPVRWVVDTHWHWDHTFGNARFPEAEIWGHELCRKTMVELGDSMKEDAAAWLPDRLEEIAEVVITPPTSVFDTAAAIDLGPVVVEMTYHGFGHTDADIVVTVGEVSFMGDLLEEGARLLLEKETLSEPELAGLFGRVVKENGAPTYGKVLCFSLNNSPK